MATFQLFFQSGRAKDLSAPMYIAFMCCVWISEQTMTFALYTSKQTGFLNRGGKCLQRGTE